MSVESINSCNLEMKACSNGSFLMSSIATMPIYGKNPLKILHRTKWKETLKKHLGLKAYQICSVDDPRLIFEISAKWSYWLPYAYIHVQEKNIDKSDFENSKRLMYHIWYRKFIDKEHENISVGWLMDDLWIKVPRIRIFKWLWGSLNDGEALL